MKKIALFLIALQVSVFYAERPKQSKCVFDKEDLFDHRARHAGTEYTMKCSDLSPADASDLLNKVISEGDALSLLNKIGEDLTEGQWNSLSKEARSRNINVR